MPDRPSERGEEQARRLAERYRLVSRATSDGVWDWDLNAGTLWWGETFFELFGYRPQEMEPGIESWTLRLHPDDLARVRNGVHAAIDGAGDRWSDEYRFRRADGSYADVFDRGFVLRDAAGKAVRMIGAMQDISGRVQAIRALRDSEERFRALMDGTVDVITVMGPDGNIRYVNPAIRAAGGYDPAEVVGRNMLDFLHPGDVAAALDTLKSALEKPQQVHGGIWRLKHRDGSYRVFESVSRNLVDVAAVSGFVLNLRDISDRRQAEAELKRSEQQLRLIVEHSPAAIAMFDRDMRYLVASRRWVDEYRLGERPIIGRSHYEVFPEIPGRWKEIHRRCLAGAVESCEEDSFTRADGTVDWTRWEVRPWHGPGGDIAGLIMFTEVITERRRAEAAVRASEEHFRALFEQAADGIFLFSQDLICRDANARCAEMLGYPREELIGMDVTRFAAAPDRPKVVPELSNLLAGRPYRREWQVERRNGSTFLVEISAAALSVGRVLVTMRDITARRHAEETLRESERRFTDMLHNMQLVSVMLDHTGQVMYCNDYLLRLTGWERMEVVGSNWFERFIPPADARAKPVFEDVLAGRPAGWHHEGEILTRAGERRLIRWNNTVLRSGAGKAIGTASIGEDITARKEAEDLMRQRAEELETFHRLSVGRELQMIELKKEINALARQAGRPPPYDLGFLERP